MIKTFVLQPWIFGLDLDLIFLLSRLFTANITFLNSYPQNKFEFAKQKVTYWYVNILQSIFVATNETKKFRSGWGLTILFWLSIVRLVMAYVLHIIKFPRKFWYRHYEHNRREKNVLHVLHDCIDKTCKHYALCNTMPYRIFSP